MTGIVSWIPTGLCFMAAFEEIWKKDHKISFAVIEVAFGILLYFWFPV